MNSLLWWLGQNTITVALMIPLVLLVGRRFRNRPAVQHALWLVVLLKIVTPPIVTWPWSADELRATLRPMPVQQESVTTESKPREFDQAIAVKPMLEYRADNIKSDEPMVAPSSPPAFPENPGERPSLLPQIAGGLWIIGAAACLLWQMRRIVRHAKLIRHSAAAPPQLMDEVRTAARQLRLRPPRALVAPGILSPFVWCLGRLRLIWPAALATPAEVVRSRGVIAHELAHLRRGDHWVAWLELAAGIVWWWNPMYWFVRRRLRETAEMACDALAIAADPAGRREYAELFLELSAGFKSGAPAPVLAVSAGTPSSFERRLSMILSDKVSGKASPWGLVAAVGLALAALPGWSLGQPKEPPKAASPADDPLLRDLIEKGRFAEAKDRLEKLRQKQAAGGDFSPKWKDILAKELPDVCRKGLPKDAAPTWTQCLGCHGQPAEDWKEKKAQPNFRKTTAEFDLLPKVPDYVLPEKRIPTADPNVVQPSIDFKGRQRLYDLSFEAQSAALTAKEPASGKVVWKSRLTDKLPSGAGNAKWTLDESPDGKLVTLSWHGKDARIVYTFDSLTGKTVRQDISKPEPTLLPKTETDYKLKFPRSDDLLEKRNPAADPTAAQPFVGLKGKQRAYELFFEGNGATLMAAETASGKIVWKSRVVEELPGRRSEDKWTVDESPDGKLVTLSWQRKDTRLVFTFDAATGKAVRRDVNRLEPLPPKTAYPAKTDDAPKTDPGVKVKTPSGDLHLKTPDRTRWEENVTGTLDLAERYLKAVADAKKARNRYDRVSKMGNAISREAVDEAKIELERAEAQAKFTTSVLSDAVKSAQAAKAQAEERYTYAERMVKRGFMSQTEVDAARAQRDQASSRLSQLESILPQK